MAPGAAPVAAPGPGGRVLEGLAAPTVALVRGLLLRPFTLDPAVAAAWATTRDIAAALLLAVLLYGVLRAQVAPLLGLDVAPPWALLPRLLFAVLGVATSLPLVRGLLSLNNALCGALLAAVPARAPVLATLTGGLAVLAAPVGLGLGPEVAAGIVLLGLAALACFYVLRSAEIVLLTLLLPLAAALWVVPAASGVYRALLGHLLVSIFVQAAQVVVLLVFSTGLGIGAPAAGGDWLWAIAALALLFRCRGLLAGAVAAGATWVPEPGRIGTRLAGRLPAGAALRSAARIERTGSGPL
jgi:hypothetical protein